MLYKISLSAVAPFEKTLAYLAAMSSQEQLQKTLSLIQLERQADLEQYRQKVYFDRLVNVQRKA